MSGRANGNVLRFPGRRGCLFSDEQMREMRAADPAKVLQTPAALRRSTLERSFLSVSNSTSKTYKAALRGLDKWLDDRDLDDGLLADYALSLHRDGKAPSTISTVLAAARFRAKALRQPNPVGPETEAVRRHVRREGAGRGKGQANPLTRDEVERVISTAERDGSVWAIRDAALVAAAFYCGLRSAEVTAVKVRDLEFRDDGTGLLSIRQSKSDQFGRGKTVPIPRPAARRISAWLRLAGIEAGPVFPAIQTNGIGGAPPKVLDRAMHKVHTGRIIRDRAKAAGFPGISSHSMRRSFAQHLSREGYETHVIAEAGRWSDLSMVLRYTQGTRAARSAVLSAFDE